MSAQQFTTPVKSKADLKIGDIVAVKGHSVPMTITNRDPSDDDIASAFAVECTWFDKNDSLNRCVFDCRTLMK